MNLDIRAVGKQALADARALLEPQAKKLGERGVILTRHLAALESDVTATLAALEKAPDEATAAALRFDLELVLPTRRKILLAAVEAELGSSVKVALDAALEVAVKVALAVARAFVPIP